MASGFGYGTESGARKDNQDTFGVFDFPVGTLLVVCDGTGSHVAGGRASALAVRTIHEHLKDARSGDDLGAALRTAVEAANRTIFEAARKNYRLMGMGTTCVAALVTDSVLRVAHVGDSRAYLIRDDVAEALTRDHTMVNLFVDAELLSPEDASTHPEAHVLSRTLGVERQVEVDVGPPTPIAGADRLMLCSDGVHKAIEGDRLAAFDYDNPQTGVQALLRAASRADGEDAATAIVWGADIVGLSAEPTPLPDPDGTTTAHVGVEAVHAVEMSPDAHSRNASGPAQDAMVMEDGDAEHDDPESMASFVSETATALPPPPVDIDATRRRGRKRAFVALGLLTLVGFGIASQLASDPAPPSVALNKSTEVEQPAERAITEAPTTEAAAAVIASSVEPVVEEPVVEEPAVPEPAEVLRESLALVDGAFWQPALPVAPRRALHRASVYTNTPPRGTEQSATILAARQGQCAKALEIVDTAVAKSRDYAQLYRPAWNCFNRSHQQPLTSGSADSPAEFKELLTHFQGETGAGADAKHGSELQWTNPATDGVELRLARWQNASKNDLFAKIVLDLIGEERVADQLATDVALEATAALAFSRLEGHSTAEANDWARHLFTARAALNGRTGDMIREHRPGLIGPLEDMLGQAARTFELVADQDQADEDVVWSVPVVVQQSWTLSATVSNLSQARVARRGELDSQQAAVARRRRIVTARRDAEARLVADAAEAEMMKNPRIHTRGTQESLDPELRVDIHRRTNDDFVSGDQ